MPIHAQAIDLSIKSIYLVWSATIDHMNHQTIQYTHQPVRSFLSDRIFNTCRKFFEQIYATSPDDVLRSLVNEWNRDQVVCMGLIQFHSSSRISVFTKSAKGIRTTFGRVGYTRKNCEIYLKDDYDAIGCTDIFSGRVSLVYKIYLSSHQQILWKLFFLGIHLYGTRGTKFCRSSFDSA